MLFKEFSYFSLGSHFVKQNGSVCATFVEALGGTFL